MRLSIVVCEIGKNALERCEKRCSSVCTFWRRSLKAINFTEQIPCMFNGIEMSRSSRLLSQCDIVLTEHIHHQLCGECTCIIVHEHEILTKLRGWKITMGWTTQQSFAFCSQTWFFYSGEFQPTPWPFSVGMDDLSDDSGANSCDQKLAKYSSLIGITETTKSRE